MTADIMSAIKNDIDGILSNLKRKSKAQVVKSKHQLLNIMTQSRAAKFYIKYWFRLAVSSKVLSTRHVP